MLHYAVVSAEKGFLEAGIRPSSQTTPTTRFFKDGSRAYYLSIDYICCLGNAPINLG